MQLSHVAAGTVAAAALSALSALPRPAAAEPGATGLYAEADLGATSFVGRKARNAKVGPAAGAHLGYDLFRWFAVGAHLQASTHEANVPPPPDQEYFQLYSAHGEGRLNLQFGRAELFASGGAGLSMISSNVLEKVGALDPGERFTISFAGGGGMEYHIQNRHYAFGLAGDYLLLPQFSAMSTVSIQLYMRYSYGGG
ncbi:MAG TPA: outer membrane beta-barrel protein [Kofleriaceae bacterium]|nr:outer membrane beta-barrel protein [Kofleriaceae bacterium]